MEAFLLANRPELRGPAGSVHLETHLNVRAERNPARGAVHRGAQVCCRVVATAEGTARVEGGLSRGKRQIRFSMEQLPQAQLRTRILRILSKNVPAVAEKKKKR